jgi:uncharacterized UPF0146 family protein
MLVKDFKASSRLVGSVVADTEYYQYFKAKMHVIYNITTPPEKHNTVLNLTKTCNVLYWQPLKTHPARHYTNINKAREMISLNKHS